MTLIAAAALLAAFPAGLKLKTRPVGEVQFASGAKLRTLRSVKQLEERGRVVPGSISVTGATGAARFRLTNRATITLEGDCELELIRGDDSLKMQLRSGRLTAETLGRRLEEPLHIETSTGGFCKFEEGVCILECLEKKSVLRFEPGGAEIETSGTLAVRKMTLPPKRWTFDPANPAVVLRRGTVADGKRPTENGSGETLSAERFVTGLTRLGGEDLRRGIVLVGDAAQVSAESRLRIRYRSDSTVNVFFTLRRRDGSFGGQHEMNAPSKNHPPDPNGWRTFEASLAGFRPAEAMRYWSVPELQGAVNRIVVTVHQRSQLEVAEVSIFEPD